MTNVIDLFPNRGPRHGRSPVTQWRVYRVHGVDSAGQDIAVTYRAMSGLSAHHRARRDGFRSISTIVQIGGIHD